MILPKEIEFPWFYFKGLDSRKMGVIVNKAPNVIRPKRRVSKVTVAGRNGVLTIDDGTFENYTKSMECAVPNREKISQVLAWLNGYGDLILSTEPGRVYKARIDNQISISQMMRYFQKFQVNFDVEPFAYNVNYFDDFMEIKRPMTIFNKGNVYSEPVITLYGSGQVDLFINEQQYRLLNVDEYVTIDCDVMEVYKGEENRNMIYSPFNTDERFFPVFEVGDNSIDWAGSVEKIEIQPNWRWY